MTHPIETEDGATSAEPTEDSADPLENCIDADQDASYACWACGEDIVIPIDFSMGSRQDYVEDCPVCCRPNEIHVEVDGESGDVRCWNDPTT